MKDRAFVPKLALICLLALLVVPLASFGEEPPKDATDSAVEAPSANDAVFELPTPEGEMSPLPGLTPKPTLAAQCSSFHFATSCFQCYAFCPKVSEDCYGTCSIRNGTDWCDCRTY